MASTSGCAGGGGVAFGTRFRITRCFGFAALIFAPACLRLVLAARASAQSRQATRAARQWRRRACAAGVAELDRMTLREEL
jgi:hypothetical protein